MCLPRPGHFHLSFHQFFSLTFFTNEFPSTNKIIIAIFFYSLLIWVIFIVKINHYRAESTISKMYMVHADDTSTEKLEWWNRRWIFQEVATLTRNRLLGNKSRRWLFILTGPSRGACLWQFWDKFWDIFASKFYAEDFSRHRQYLTKKKAQQGSAVHCAFNILPSVDCIHQLMQSFALPKRRRIVVSKNIIKGIH